jgi:hypothetical protein
MAVEFVNTIKRSGSSAQRDCGDGNPLEAKNAG